MITYALVATLALAANETPSQEIRVSPGTQKVVKFPGLTRAALGSETYADIKPLGSGNELLITGRAKGRTSLTLWGKGGKPTVYNLVVDDDRTTQLARIIHEKVNSSLKVDEFNGRIVVDGMVDSIEEVERLKVLVADEPSVKLLVRLNPAALPALATVINEAFKKQGLHSAKAVVVGGKIVLEGSVTDDDERRKAQSIADGYLKSLNSGG